MGFFYNSGDHTLVFETFLKLGKLQCYKCYKFVTCLSVTCLCLEEEKTYKYRPPEKRRRKKMDLPTKKERKILDRKNFYLKKLDSLINFSFLFMAIVILSASVERFSFSFLQKFFNQGD